MSRAYRTRMRSLSDKPYLDIWFTPTRAEAAVDALGDDSGPLESALEDGLGRTNLATLPKLTDEANGRRRFREDPPVVTRRAYRLRCELPAVLTAYRRSLTADRRLFLDRYTVTDVARKVVGVGSVGLGSYVLLLQAVGSDDPLFLQLKEAPPSVLEAHISRRVRFRTMDSGWSPANASCRPPVTRSLGGRNSEDVISMSASCGT